MKCLSEKAKEILAITLMVLVIQLPVLIANDGAICPVELFYMGSVAVLMACFIGHFCRKE